MDEKIITDLGDAMSKIEEVKVLINRLYYDPEFSSVFNRPVLSLLSAACDYLAQNLTILRNKAREK